MITKEDILNVNEKLKTLPVKGKDYAPVTERVKAFREICPNGMISTEIVSMEDGVVVMKATVCDKEGTILATGLAYEKESSSYINKTSYIENCETSAVGRALGFCGIGIDASMASAEELANALKQQADIKQMEVTLHDDRHRMEQYIRDNYDSENLSIMLEHYKAKDLSDMTDEQILQAYVHKQKGANK